MTSHFFYYHITHAKQKAPPNHGQPSFYSITVDDASYNGVCIRTFGDEFFLKKS